VHASKSAKSEHHAISWFLSHCTSLPPLDRFFHSLLLLSPSIPGHNGAGDSRRRLASEEKALEDMRLPGAQPAAEGRAAAGERAGGRIEGI
jgi:hypothetical protein